MSLFFDDIPIGREMALGCVRFTAYDIKQFAQRYDPQYFHLDEERARDSLFGGLCASGWHTSSMWMRQMVRWQKRAIEQAERDGQDVPEFGPSPGFTELKWHKPVFAGDEIEYFFKVVDKRASRSRPKWGLVYQRNWAINQHRAVVFSFWGCHFVERRQNLVPEILSS